MVAYLFRWGRESCLSIPFKREGQAVEGMTFIRDGESEGLFVSSGIGKLIEFRH